MILRLDPRFPMVWRTPTSVQLGIDPPLVVLDPVTELEERVLAALAVGVGESGLTMIARGQTAVRDALLARLEPVLEGADPAAEPPLVAVSGLGPLSIELDAVLRASGLRVLLSPDPADLADEEPSLAVAIGHLVLPPALHALWLRRDVPHLPIVFSDGGVTVGPVVEPGTGPCLLCLELHRRDADPAWPAIATQLLGRSGSAESRLTAAESAAVAARIVLRRLVDGPAASAESVRLDAATGERTTSTWHPHPECGCRGIPPLPTLAAVSPARPGNGWADAARHGPTRHRPTSSAPGDDAPA